MKNWTVDIERFKKEPKRYKLWRLEQLINFGLDDERLNRQELQEYFDRLDIDKDKKKYLGFLLKSK